MNNIVEVFSQSLPLPGEVQSKPITELGAYEAAFAVDAHGAFTGRLSVYVADRSAFSVSSEAADLETLLSPALEAAAAEAGATVTAPAVAQKPGDTAALYEILFLDSGAHVFLAIEVTEVPAEISYDPAEVRRIENVKLDISVVVGKTTMSIAELLSLKPGQVVDLDRPAGSPVDILVNGEHVAAGEVVVLDQDYGVKINRVIRMPQVH